MTDIPTSEFRIMQPKKQPTEDEAREKLNDLLNRKPPWQVQLEEENKRLQKQYDVAIEAITHLRSSPFIVGRFFQEDGLTPRKTIMICPMEGSDALYDYVLKEKSDE